MTPGSQRVAAPLRAALEQLRLELAPLAGIDDIGRYRVAGAARRIPIAETAARLGLGVVEHRLGMLDATELVPDGLMPGGLVRARLVFLHGGGLVAGTRADGVDVVARHAAELACTVTTLEYPLAPEASLDEMVAAVLAALADLGAGAPIVLAGCSGGGGLAVTTALACRDAAVPLAGVLLICPMLGASRSAPAASRRQFAGSPAWTAVADDAAWAAVTARGQLLEPSQRDDLHGLPPTFLDVGTAELFRDDVLAFSSRLLAAGVQAELHVWSGAFHASDSVVEDAAVSVEAHRARGEWLRRLLDDEL